MDNAKFHHIVMGRTKTELQDMLLKLGPAAYGLASDLAVIAEDGTVAPINDQEDADVIAILKVTGT